MRVLLLYITVCCFMLKAGAQSPASPSAETAFQSGNYVEAINLYAKDTSLQAQLQIARAYQALGNYDKAKKQYRSVIKNDSSLLVAQNELGKLYYRLSGFEEAKQVYNALTHKDSLNPFYYYQLGKIENRQREMDSAISFFKKSYRLDSTNIKNLYEIGKYYLRTRQFDSVHKYADIGLALSPNSIDMNNIKALAYYNFDEKEAAIPYLEKLIELHQEETYIYKYLAECYEFMWEPEKAFACYKKVIEIDKNDPDGYNGLGHAYIGKKLYDSAKINFKTAIEIQKVNLYKEYNSLAYIALEEKKVKSAIDYYKMAFSQDETNFHPLYQVCFYSDKYYKDPAYKIRLYEDFLERFPDKRFYSEYAQKRISELKQEIHLADVKE